MAYNEDLVSAYESFTRALGGNVAGKAGFAVHYNRTSFYMPSLTSIKTERFSRRVDSALINRDFSTALAEEIPPNARFIFPWTTVEGAVMRRLLEQLTDPCSTISNNVIDYFANKLTSGGRGSGLRVHRWSYSNSPDNVRPRTLIIIGNPADWSVIEVQVQLGIIVHYKHTLLQVQHDNNGCHYCRKIPAAVDKVVETDQDIIPRWRYQTEILPGPPEHYGLSLLWVLHLRRRNNDLFPMPSDYRSTLLHGLLVDIKAAYAGGLLLGQGSTAGHIGWTTEPEIHTPARLREFWITFGEQQGFGTRVWDKLLQLNGRGPHRTSLTRTSELVQMALNVAAPEVLADMKDCLGNIRSRCKLARHSYQASRETCEITPLTESKSLYSIHRRLWAWKSYHLTKQRQKKCGTYMQANGHGKKGVYWDHIVQYVGDGNPGILCLIPRRVTISPLSEPCRLNATSYRDLAVWECKLVGEICEEFRPGVVSAVDASLCSAFLSLEEPSTRYIFEEWSKQRIREQQLSSDFFLQAFARLEA